MSASKRGGLWRYRIRIKLPSGESVDLSGTPAIDSKAEAIRAESDHIKRVLEQARNPRKEYPTFSEWFLGKYWDNYVLGRKNNKSATKESKLWAHDLHLKALVGNMPINEIDQSVVDGLVGKLRQTLGIKSTNNILMILGTSLKYAEELRVIDRAPKTVQLKFLRPEIEFLEFDQYRRGIHGARKVGPHYLVAYLFAGESGMRIGEIVGAQWGDVDLEARTVTIRQQLRHGEIISPKGGRARTIPMTDLLWNTLNEFQPDPEKRHGIVLTDVPRCKEQSASTDENQIRVGIRRISRAAKLHEFGWHTLRHTFASHSALFGIDPFTLQSWLGHSGLGDTLQYCRLAKNKRRPLPGACREVSALPYESPDDRIIAMLGQRYRDEVGTVTPNQLGTTLENPERHLKLVG